MIIDTEEVKKAYSDGAWGDLSIFPGGLINFGFWQNIIDQNYSDIISEQMKLRSSLALYDVVLGRMDNSVENQVLEIGCGRGIGAIHLVKNYNIKSLYGIDLSKDQVAHAKENAKTNGLVNKLNFIHANIENTSILENTIDYAVSVEVFQHIEKTKEAFKNIRASLKKDAVFAMTTFFGVASFDKEELSKRFPLMASGYEEIKSINTIQSDLLAAGFNDISINSIGDKVFYGFDKWGRQLDAPSCTYTHYQGYKEKIIDYYVIFSKA